jgi:hypothetical protein
MKQNRFPFDPKTTETEPRSLRLTTAANLGNSQYEWQPTAGNRAALRAIRDCLEDGRFGSGGPITAYGEFGENTVEVIASDTGGNASPAVTTTLFIP